MSVRFQVMWMLGSYGYRELLNSSVVPSSSVFFAGVHGRLTMYCEGCELTYLNTIGAFKELFPFMLGHASTLSLL